MLLWKIKNEPSQYIKNVNKYHFKNFILYLPSWWTIVINENNLIRFERTDTRYDWYTEYWTIDNSDLSIGEILLNYIDELKLTFDDKNNLENFEINSISIARAEGMSTINGIREHILIFLWLRKTIKF